jgi:CBS domain containing-hemolysin-like protein
LVDWIVLLISGIKNCKETIDDQVQSDSDYPTAVIYQNNINNLAHIFVTDPFSQLSTMTKIYQWFSWTRWFVAAIIPIAFFFTGRILFLLIHTVLSLLTFVFAITSNKNRKGLPGLLILLSELFAFLWILSTMLLAIDSNQDFDFFGGFFTKLFIWIQYIFWVLNHIFELILAFLCFSPVKDLDENTVSTKQTNRGKIETTGNNKTAVNKPNKDENDAVQVIDPTTQDNKTKKEKDTPDDKAPTVDEFAFSM